MPGFDPYMWREIRGGSLGEQGAGGVREMEEERAGSGISTEAGSRKEIQKGKRSLLILLLLIIQSKTETEQPF